MLKLFNPYSLLSALLLLGSAPSLVVSANIQLPEIGDPSENYISVEEDRRLGQAFMRSVRRSLTLIEDPEINGYINALGYRLLGGVDVTHPQFTFFVVDNPLINAFAGPGGYIGIHSGLILAAESEGELAAVVAHEIAHITQRHLARAFEKVSNVGLQTAAAIIAAIILGSQNAQMGQAALAVATAGTIQRQLNFTRAHEREADRVGITILNKAHFDPTNMPRFFQRLQNSLRYTKSGLPELLRTHPVTTSRIADSKNRAALYPSIKDKSSFEFKLVQARLRIHSTDEIESTIKQIEHELNNSGSERPSSAIKAYEYTLALLRNDHLNQARKVIIKIDEANEIIPYISARARIEMAAGNYKSAEKSLADALTLYPGQATLTLLYTEVLNHQGESDRAVKLLRALIRQEGRFTLPSYYHALARAQNLNKESFDAYLSLAEYYYLIGQTRSAISQLEAAQHRLQESDSYHQKRIEARLKTLRDEALQEQKKEGNRH